MRLIDVISKLEEFNIHFYLHNNLRIGYIKHEKMLYTTYRISIYNYDEKIFLTFKESITSFDWEFYSTIDDHIMDLYFNDDNETMKIEFFKCI